MRRRIPSTTALVTFETAARYENLSRAAEELCLTESAISRQISGLEDYLGLKLFSRVKGRIRLSAAGRTYADQIRDVLDQLEQRTLDIAAAQDGKSTLRIAAIPTFATKWLLPRLKAFTDAHPDIVIDLCERATPFAFDTQGLDAVIHFEHPHWAGATKIHLFDEEVVPVISPRHFNVAALKSPCDLARLPLLHKAMRQDCWARWFERARCPQVNAQAGPRYELYSTMIEGVKAGLGAGLLPRIYVASELASGELIIPFDTALDNEKSYCVILPDGSEESPALTAFIQWLVETVAQFRTMENTAAPLKVAS